MIAACNECSAALSSFHIHSSIDRSVAQYRRTVHHASVSHDSTARTYIITMSSSPSHSDSYGGDSSIAGGGGHSSAHYDDAAQMTHADDYRSSTDESGGAGNGVNGDGSGDSGGAQGSGPGSSPPGGAAAVGKEKVAGKLFIGLLHMR